jgi:predicted membrane protein
MDKKKIAIIVIAGFILIGMIAFVAVEIKKGENASLTTSQKNNNTKKEGIVEKKAISDAFKQNIENKDKKKSAEFSGTVESLSEKSIVIKTVPGGKSLSVNFDRNTKFFLLDATGNNQVSGTLNDLELKNMVKGEYDQETNNLISLIIGKVKK